MILLANLQWHNKFSESYFLWIDLKISSIWINLQHTKCVHLVNAHQDVVRCHLYINFKWNANTNANTQFVLNEYMFENLLFMRFSLQTSKFICFAKNLHISWTVINTFQSAVPPLESTAACRRKFHEMKTDHHTNWFSLVFLCFKRFLLVFVT